MDMKNKILAIFLIGLLVLPLFSEERKEKEDFIPAPLPEKAAMDILPHPLPPVVGLTVTSAATITGLALTVKSAYDTVDLVLDDPSGPEVREGLFKTGSLIIGTALTAVLVDFFIDEIISEE